MLPQLLTAARDALGVQEEIRILTATSGDTGKAALEGFHDVPGVGICVFYPDGGVSQVQRAQMVTQEGSNVHVCAVRGNFDDAQTGVKQIFAACQGKQLPFRLSSANSINIGRLAPQIVYYFRAYRDLLDRGVIQMGQQVNFSVPTGNFGDILAGYLAKQLAPQIVYYFRAYRDLLDRGVIQMGQQVNFSVPTGNFGDILAGYLAKQLGLPAGTLLCASNANNVLTDFITTGTYDRRRPLLKTTSPSMDILVSSNLERLLKTTSPSMDILVSSNLERLLYLLSQDTALVASLMEQLNREGVYTVPEGLLAPWTFWCPPIWSGCCISCPRIPPWWPR